MVAIRKMCLHLLKRYFCHQLVQTRTTLGLTQFAMAERLMMDERSYIELDHGNSGCSALTLALFLIYCCEDPLGFLHELRSIFENGSGYAA